MSRIILALLALLALTAFAPAPFPKNQRRNGDAALTVDSIQGLWRVTAMRTARPNGQHENYQWTVTHIRVAKDRWNWVYGEQTDPGAGTTSGSTFGVDPTKRPAHFHFITQNGAQSSVNGPGLIRRRAGRLEIIYTWGGETVRSPSFEAPTNGHWLLTLEFVRR